MFVYDVECTFTNAEVAAEWQHWLTSQHLQDVCAAGAQSAELVRFDGEPLRYATRYHFASRAAFETYEREHAPRLRAEGLERFPLERGLSYSRRTGTPVATR